MDDFYARDPDIEVLLDQEIDSYEDQFYEEVQCKPNSVDALIEFANQHLVRHFTRDYMVWFCLEDSRDAFKFEIPVQVLAEGWCKDYVHIVKIDQNEVHYIPADRLLEILEGYWKTCLEYAIPLSILIRTPQKVTRCPPKIIEIINTLPI